MTPARESTIVVIRRSFLIFPGIGEKRERLLWKAGVRDWEEYLAAPQVSGIRPAAKRAHDTLVRRALDAQLEGDLTQLAALFPTREHWRFHGDEAPRAGYLDIETTGADPRSTITVVGILEGATGKFHQLVAGDDLDHANLHAILSRIDIFVTFNGTGFDVPVLRNQFPRAIPHIPHLDLRGALARLGYTGGLKRIEQELGLARPDAVKGIDGYEAVLLWRRWKTRGDRAALDTLCAYNKEDVVNLEGLASFATAVLHNRLCGYWDGAPRPIRWPGPVAPARVAPELDGTPGLPVVA